MCAYWELKIVVESDAKVVHNALVLTVKIPKYYLSKTRPSGEFNVYNKQQNAWKWEFLFQLFLVLNLIIDNIWGEMQVNLIDTPRTENDRHKSADSQLANGKRTEFGSKFNLCLFNYKIKAQRKHKTATQQNVIV